MVLSTLLKYPELVHTTNGLRFYMFSSTPHETLYQEIEELLEKQLTPEPTLVVASLESKGMIDKVGGKKYIDFLLSREANKDTFQEYISIVTSSYKGRSLLSMVAGIKKENLNSENIDELISSTRRGLDGLIEMKSGLSTFHISDAVLSTYEEIVARMKNPGIRGVSWGVESVDKATGGKSPGDVIVIAGRPGSGKTSAVINSIYEDAKLGVPSLLIEKEMRTQELMERLISVDTGIPSTDLRLGVLSNDQVCQVRDSLAKLKQYPIYIDTNYRSTDPYYIEATVNKFKNKHGIQNVYLDYIQLATERDDGQTMEIGRMTRLFKVMSNELGICSVLLSQLNRNVEAREDKRPVLSDMRQSGSIEEDADFVIGLYRDEYYNKETNAKGIMEYIILKHRNGPTGTVPVKFHGPTYRISEA
jgi:replicative DNA helicase